MANWYGTARSNYVKIDRERLSALLGLFPGIRAYHKGELTCFLDEDGEGAPSIEIDDDEQEELLEKLGVENPDNIDDANFLDLVHCVLIDEPDNVFVWIEAGAEKLRYVSGFSVAIAPDGTVLKQVGLADIYEGTNWTRAEY